MWCLGGLLQPSTWEHTVFPSPTSSSRAAVEMCARLSPVSTEAPMAGSQSAGSDPERALMCGRALCRCQRGPPLSSSTLAGQGLAPRVRTSSSSSALCLQAPCTGSEPAGWIAVGFWACFPGVTSSCCSHLLKHSQALGSDESLLCSSSPTLCPADWSTAPDSGASSQ